MTIKKTLFLLWVALMGSSFSAHAALVKVLKSERCVYFDGAALSGGDIVDTSSLIGKTFSDCRKTIGVITSASAVNAGSFLNVRINGSGYNTYQLDWTFKGCALGTEHNPETNACEEPIPDCSEYKGKFAHSNSWDYFNLGSRPTFCTEQCTTTIGISNYSCDLGSGSCTADLYYSGENCTGDASPGGDIPDRPHNGCVIHPTDPSEGYFCPKDNDGDGLPDPNAELDPLAYCKYDAGLKFSCKGGSYDKPFEPKDPTTPIEPPSGGGSVTDPANPSLEVDEEPNVEEPTPAPEGSNADMVAAITNQNRDVNKMLRGLNIDNNKNFAKVNDNLNMLNQRQQNTSDNIVSQMRQDIKIYENQKALQLAMHGDVVSSLKNNGSNQLKELGDIGNRVTKSGDKVTDAINNLSDKLGAEECVPTADNKYCENPHGVDSNLVSTVFGQMDDSANEIMSGAYSSMLGKVQETIDTPLTTKTEGVIQKSTDHLLNIIGVDNSCSPLVFGKKDSYNFTLGCDISAQIKVLLSFILGAWTLMTLLDILLDGITPLGSRPSAVRYA